MDEFRVTCQLLTRLFLISSNKLWVVAQRLTGHDVVQDADSDEEDDEIKATDNLLINGRCEGDASMLEVYGKAWCEGRWWRYKLGPA